MIQIIFVGAP